MTITSVYMGFQLSFMTWKYREIHCTKLRISICNPDNELSVYVLDTEAYLIDGGVDFLVMSALHVQVSFGLTST